MVAPCLPMFVGCGAAPARVSLAVPPLNVSLVMVMMVTRGMTAWGHKRPLDGA
jgi:hypothetical protein